MDHHEGFPADGPDGTHHDGIRGGIELLEGSADGAETLQVLGAALELGPLAAELALVKGAVVQSPERAFGHDSMLEVAGQGQRTDQDQG